MSAAIQRIAQPPAQRICMPMGNSYATAGDSGAPIEITPDSITIIPGPDQNWDVRLLVDFPIPPAYQDYYIRQIDPFPAYIGASRLFVKLNAGIGTIVQHNDADGAAVFISEIADWINVPGKALWVRLIHGIYDTDDCYYFGMVDL